MHTSVSAQGFQGRKEKPVLPASRVVVGQEASGKDWYKSEGRPFTIPLEQSRIGHCRTSVHRLRTSFLFPGDLVPREGISTPAWCYCPLMGQKGKRLFLGDRSHKHNAFGFIYRSTFSFFLLPHKIPWELLAGSARGMLVRLPCP